MKKRLFPHLAAAVLLAAPIPAQAGPDPSPPQATKAAALVEEAAFLTPPAPHRDRP
jgi:hypothetical protein